MYKIIAVLLVLLTGCTSTTNLSSVEPFAQSTPRNLGDSSQMLHRAEKASRAKPRPVLKKTVPAKPKVVKPKVKPRIIVKVRPKAKPKKIIIKVKPYRPPGGIAACIRKYESGGDYRAQNPYSTASGAYQFLDSTWRRVTGRHDRAKNAPKSVQDKAFYKLWNHGRGASQWTTAHKCGY
jgi:hypothetical protein